MKIIRDFKELQNLAQTTQRHLIPTMGALHPGHLSLVEAAKKQIESSQKKAEVWVSIFLNPLQFNNPTDLEKYPISLEQDIRSCEKAGVDYLFLPTNELMYPSGFSTKVFESTLGQYLCGATRPGHFDGVCTVVNKLFNLVQPTAAYFGKKDFQQLAIIKKMVLDLNINIQIHEVATLREADGLAMSSRNLKLSKPQRALAPLLHQSLLSLGEALQSSDDWERLKKSTIAYLEENGFTLDYLELVSSSTLAPISKPTSNAICAIAAFLGDVRLIDHITLSHE